MNVLCCLTVVVVVDSSAGVEVVVGGWVGVGSGVGSGSAGVGVGVGVGACVDAGGTSMGDDCGEGVGVGWMRGNVVWNGVGDDVVGAMRGSVVSLANAVLSGVEVFVTSPFAVVVSPPCPPPAPSPSPNTFSATLLSVHPTNTPSVTFIGIAKQLFPSLHTSVIWKLPSELQFAWLPAIHAISPLVQGEEKLRAEKRAL